MDPVKMATGATQPPTKPKFLVLNAQELEGKEEIKTLRDFIKLDRIEFVFPEGLASVPVLEECRALCDLDNFDVLYDLTMQYLVGKRLEIIMINDDGSKSTLGHMHVTTKDDDLRFMQCVADYPYLVYWLTEFMAGYLAKKFPLPSSGQSPGPKAERKKKKTGIVKKVLRKLLS